MAAVQKNFYHEHAAVTRREQVYLPLLFFNLPADLSCTQMCLQVNNDIKPLFLDGD